MSCLLFSWTGGHSQLQREGFGGSPRLKRAGLDTFQSSPLIEDII